MLTHQQLIEQGHKASQGYLLLFGIALFFALIFVVSERFRQSNKIYFSIPLWFSIILGSFLRVPSLFEAFWYDETFTANIANASINAAVQVILSDVHPPLAYLPFWIIGQFTNNAFIMRLPSFLAGIGIILVVYMIGKYWDKRTAEYSAFFAAIMPSLVWYSTELRAYSIFTLVSLLVIYAYLFQREKLFYVSLALLPLVHTYGYVYAALFGVIMLAYHRYHFNRLPIVKMIIAAIPATLWIPFLIMQSSDVLDGFWISAPTLGSALHPITELTIGSAYPALVALIAIPICLFCTMLALWHERENFLFQIILFSVPIIMLIISYTISPIYLYRALLPSGVILVFFFAKWSQDAPRLAMILIACLVLVNSMKLHPDAQRVRTDQFIAACGDRDIYAITVDAAMIANHYSNNTVYVFTDASNLNQSLPSHALSALGMQIRSIAPKNACIYWQDTPLTSDVQRENLQLSLELINADEALRLLDKNTLVIEVYR